MKYFITYKKLFSVTLIAICSLWLVLNTTAQESNKQDIFKILEQNKLEASKKKQHNFDHWMYSEKKHAIFGYFSPQFMQGFGNDASPYNINQYAGLMHRSYLVNNDWYKLNFHGWLEYGGQVAGSRMKDFTKEMGMISPVNDGFLEDHSLVLMNFYFENFFFDGKLDLTIGKMDPLFVNLITNYSGWDRYNYFSKSASSNPVPDIGESMGAAIYFNPTNKLSFGFMATDADAKNDYLYIPDFSSSAWNYQVSAHWKFGGKMFSEHNFILYHQPSFTNKDNVLLPEGNGWAYTGNQEIADDLILILKLSHGNGRVDKLNGAYVAGLTFVDLFNRIGDQAGFALITNEKNNKYEYGTDLYWRFYITEWINIGTNVQAYYTVNNNINWILGGRIFIGY